MKNLPVKRLLIIVFAFCALIFSSVSSARAQVQVRITPIDTIGVNDTISFGAWVVNYDTSSISVSLGASYRGNILDSTNFYTSPVNFSVSGQDSNFVTGFIINTPTNPLPGLAPGGGSVVVWPIFNGSSAIDSGRMTLYYLDPLSINDPAFPTYKAYFSANQLHVQFNQPQVVAITVYDMQGRVMHNAAGDTAYNNIDVGTLADGVYIVTLQVAQKTGSFKFVKY